MDNLNTDVCTNFGDFSSFADLYCYMCEEKEDFVYVSANYWGVSIKDNLSLNQVYEIAFN